MVKGTSRFVAISFELRRDSFDLVYIDSPYHTSFVDNDYPRQYHFVEGLMSYWNDVQIDCRTKTKKFAFRKTWFDSRSTVEKAFQRLFKKFRGNTLVVSYSSTSHPSRDDMKRILQEAGKRSEIIETEYLYSFATQRKRIENNRTKEYIFVSR